MKDFFSFRETIYNFRLFQSVYFHSKKAVECGTETITYRGPHMTWNLIPENIRNALKEKLKNGMPTYFYVYIQRVGYV